METFRLSRLNEFIQRVIALNFDSPIWITAELIQAKLNKGHYYLELAERSDLDEIIAQSSAVIWKNNWKNLIKKIPDGILKEGIQLRLFALVDYHPKFGLKLNIQDIDESYTLGEIAKQRQATIDLLKKDELWQLNKLSQIPLVIKNIAVITSLTSAGRKDFESQLWDNSFGYTYTLHYFEASMQGINTNLEVSQAIIKINQIKKIQFDCIVIIRGGGAKLDLIDFDYYDISKQISLSQIPIVTGIGHHQDESIADMNAFLSLKTPTAVADYLIQHNYQFEAQIISSTESIYKLTQQFITSNYDQLQILKNKIQYTSSQSLHKFQFNIKESKFQLKEMTTHFFQQKKLELIQLTNLLNSQNPLEILKKGYSMNYQGKKRIKRIEDINFKLPMTSVFEDGSITSKILSND